MAVEHELAAIGVKCHFQHARFRTGQARIGETVSIRFKAIHRPAPLGCDSHEWAGPGSVTGTLATLPKRGSNPRQALRAVAGNPHTSDLLQRPVRLRGIPHQFRGIWVDLMEKGTFRA